MSVKSLKENQAEEQQPAEERKDLGGLFLSVLEVEGFECSGTAPSLCCGTAPCTVEDAIDDIFPHIQFVALGRAEKMAPEATKTVISIDSGAAVTICPRYLIEDYPWVQTGNGVSYETALGQLVADEGLKVVEVKIQGNRYLVRTRVGQVSKWLLATSGLADTGHFVEFSKSGGRAVHQQSGRAWNFERRRGIFEVDVEIVPFVESTLRPAVFAGTGSTKTLQ